MATISSDVLATYAADAARDVAGVRVLGRRGVRVVERDGSVRIVLHVAVDWGVSIPDVGREVQARVAAYLARMASVDADAIDVVVDEVGAP